MSVDQANTAAHGSPVLTPQVTLAERDDIQVIRAEIQHLPLLVPLFDQYRIFYEQSSDLAGAEQFLREKILQQQSVIFLAVPSANTTSSTAAASTTSSSATSAAIDPSITPAENAASYAVSANNLTTATAASSSSTTLATDNSQSQSAPSLPPFALGFTQLYPSFSSVRMCRHWILNDLFVSPSSRKQGVGALLLNHARKFAEHSGAGSMQLETAVTNVTAQRLYESMKWEKVTDEFYYSQRYK